MHIALLALVGIVLTAFAIMLVLFVANDNGVSRDIIPETTTHSHARSARRKPHTTAALPSTLSQVEQAQTQLIPTAVVAAITESPEAAAGKASVVLPSQTELVPTGAVAAFSESPEAAAAAAKASIVPSPPIVAVDDHLETKA